MTFGKHRKANLRGALALLLVSTPAWPGVDEHPWPVFNAAEMCFTIPLINRLEGYVDFSLPLNITVDVKIDTITEVVSVVMTGPVGRWWGVGFGNNEMSGTYTIMAREDDLNVEEYLLDNRGPGYHINPAEITVNSDTNNGTTRTVSLTRGLTGNSYPGHGGSYTFPTTEAGITLIAGYGISNDDFLNSAGFMGDHSDSNDPPVASVDTVPRAVNFCL